MRYRRGIPLFGTLLTVFLCVGLAGARTWRVTPEQSGDAPTIQAAMDSAVAGDHVLLTPGMYTLTSQGTVTPWYMIDMKAGVTLRGEAGPEQTLIDAEGFTRVIRCSDVGAVRIEGVTIARGVTVGVPEEGGGIWCTGDSQPEIVNCIIRDCRSSEKGGGIFCANATITNCQILDNRAGLQRGFGGGIDCDNNTVISGCVIRGNAVLGDNSACGGGVCARGLEVRVLDCLFENNNVSGAFSAGGGGLAGAISVRNSVFVNNTAWAAASGRAGGGGASTLGEVADCVFVGNRAIASGGHNAEGGAVSGGWDAFTMTRCTLIGNAAIGGSSPVAGVFVSAGGPVTSTIIAWNEGAACGGTSDFALSCSNLFGNSLGDSVCSIDGGGNFSQDPQFCAVDPVMSLNLLLQEDSPCTPGNHPTGSACGLIGAEPAACGTVQVRRRSWSAVKSFYR